MPDSISSSSSSPHSIALCTVVTFGAVEEYKILRFSFELFHGAAHRWFIRCDAKSEAVLRDLPNTSCVASITETPAGKATPEDGAFNAIVEQKMAVMEDAWAAGDYQTVVFMDADLVVTAPFLHLLPGTDSDSEIVLTPHYFAAERRRLEESRYGLYNSGFVAAKVRSFPKWWSTAYRSEPQRFTDQQCLDDAGKHFRVAHLPPPANVGSWRGPLGTEGMPEFEIPADCLFLHVHFLQPGDEPESLVQKRFAAEYFQYVNLLKGVRQQSGAVFTPRQIVQKAFAIECLRFLNSGHRPEHKILFDDILRRDGLRLYEKALSAASPTVAAPAVASDTDSSKAPSIESLPEGDYVSPGLDVVRPDRHFPHLSVADKSRITWQHFRCDTPHNYWSDSRYPECGFLNRDEAQILYNAALQFRGRRGLEIGCWMGWSACHIALGGVTLDVIDPLLENPVFQQSVLSSLRSAGVLNRVQLFVGKSPDLVEELGAKKQRRWSFIFIDGSHNAPDPLNDARAALQFAEPDAMILFHDLASPDAAQGLDYLRDAGWSTVIYQTTQIMGAAWRGNVQPVPHIPDPSFAWTLPEHLTGYEVSGASKPRQPATFCGSGRLYKVDGITLELPTDHLLPVFQQQHPLYDRFLPFLGPLAPEGSWIIDVGANIGDTVASIVRHTSASILAIEGHETFAAYLEKNVGSMPDYLRGRVRCARALVGSGAITGKLQAENGTAKWVDAQDSLAEPVESLEDILSRHSIDPARVFLVKTDTDGFDADVLQSGPGLLRDYSPVLYFENQIDEPAQVAQYASLYETLSRSGYSHYWVFDNFGNLLLEDIGIEALSSLNRYLFVQQQKRSTRTFYYCDILAAKPEWRARVQGAVDSYKRFVTPHLVNESGTDPVKVLQGKSNEQFATRY